MNLNHMNLAIDVYRGKLILMYQTYGYLAGGMYTQQTPAQQFPQQMPPMTGFGQQNNFPNQGLGALGQMNTVPGQLGMQNQLGGLPSNQLGVQLGPVAGSHLGGNNVNLGQMSQINGVQNSTMGLSGNQMGGMVSVAD